MKVHKSDLQSGVRVLPGIQEGILGGTRKYLVGYVIIHKKNRGCIVQEKLRLRVREKKGLINTGV